MKCHYCTKDSFDSWLQRPVSDFFTMFSKGADHWCAVCGEWKKLCKDHRRPTLDFDLRHATYGMPYDLCPECFQWRDDAAKPIITVRSSHVGSHTIIKTIGRIATKHQHRDRDAAAWEIKYNAALVGANAITNLNYISHKAQDGNYIFKKWTASGDLVVVEPK